MIYRASFGLRSILCHGFFGLFVAVFVAEIDKLMFRAGWVSIPGGAVVVYIVIVAAIVGGSLTVADPVQVKCLWSELTSRVRDNRFFLLSFMGLFVMSLIYWLADVSDDPTILFDISKSFLVCVTSMILLIICFYVRRFWRVYLSIGFVVYCLSIWIDALRPGIFTELVGLGNFVAEGRVSGVSGLNLDSNSGSYVVVLLAISLLDYRRFKIIDLAVLSFAALSILLTLSRSGLLIIILIVICYFVLVVVKSPRRRRFVTGSFGIAAVLTVLCGWAAIRFIAHYENPKAQIAINQLLVQDEWFRVRLHSSNEYLIRLHLQPLESFGQVNAPKAPEPTVPSLPESTVTEVAVPTTSESLAPGVRSYINFVDGGEYVHIESRRIARLRNALDAIAASPFIGNGIGFDLNAGISAHNMFLALWIDFGLFGLIIYTTFLLIGFWKFYRVKYWLGIFFMLTIGSISMFIQHIFTLFTVFFVMGLVLSMRSNDQTDQLCDGRLQ